MDNWTYYETAEGTLVINHFDNGIKQVNVYWAEPGPGSVHDRMIEINMDELKNLAAAVH